MKNLLMAIPFLILFGNGVCFVWREWYYESYAVWYAFIVQIYALLWLYFMWYIAKIKRFCAFSFVAIYGLVALTCFNLVYFYLTYGYDRELHPEIFEKYDNMYHAYAGILVLCAIIISIIQWVRQR